MKTGDGCIGHQLAAFVAYIHAVERSGAAVVDALCLGIQAAARAGGNGFDFGMPYSFVEPLFADDLCPFCL